MSGQQNKNITRIEVILTEKDEVTLSVLFDVGFGKLGAFPEPEGASKYRAKEFHVQAGKNAYVFRSLEEALHCINGLSRPT